MRDRVKRYMHHCGLMTKQPKAEVYWAACNTCTAQPFLITKVQAKPVILNSQLEARQAGHAGQPQPHSALITEFRAAHSYYKVWHDHPARPSTRKVKAKAVRQFTVDAIQHRVAHSLFRYSTVLQNNAGTSTGPGLENVLSGMPMWNNGWQARSPLSCL